ncbi:hydantoinase/oxoprolinase [Candidatus Methanomassiliicoccus intestinalis]|uniref:Hydantoinase/oxoprolinase n=1 Tax=Methanomassiliicoccus intestinalis (strain Issoire-Mx1) TaxID=1295009 RepID=R9T5K4_METII|nr:hydantoinase/oxoprolinase family protein [Candidatus Methanomassiliicoccus intestinalis]AGN25844.1 Hydantoinase/oxoprolinase [Candidatus Methanomassiliicoccus intestinalis Issoire-Mx1]TQS83262.1 MAG: hydantoinase/oxoprolinase [Candidatus Methanomassiliicoccus intestinalis]
MELGLGIDTGGTYTDAVLIDLESNSIISKAKALTTRDDLSVGIRNSMKLFDRSLLKKVSMVSLSSTLATNSVVEGKGCRVGVISVGRDFDSSIVADESITISGGHDLNGAELNPLDIDSAEKFMNSIKSKVDSIAITSYLSVRNPEHELILKDLASKILNLPVVCGHELSSSLGFNERTITSVMNARLIPIIKELINSMKSAMVEYDINAPLMIVKGDGSLMNDEIAVERPVETVLSGPAASMIGAKTLTGLNDAIVMDMGGTTTDIGILRNGQPRLEKEGAMIGGKRTRVLAAEIYTSGIGGDSRIVVKGNKFSLTPLRVMPLCIATTKWPQLFPRLEEISKRCFFFNLESINVNNIVQDIEFFVKIKDIKDAPLSENDRKLLEYISNEPFSLSEAGASLNLHPFAFNVSKMEELGMIQRIGLTPTDILHAEGSYIEYDRKASEYGVKHQALKMNMLPEEFISFAKEKVIEKISEELLKKLFLENIGTFELDKVSKALVDRVVSGSSDDFSCSISLNLPIIGIGAPVSAYYPLMSEKLNAKLFLPEYSEVGNAIGAVTGSVIEQVEILIKPVSGSRIIDDPNCTLFATFGKYEYETWSKAVEDGKTLGCEYVKRRALKSGARNVDINIVQDDREYTVGMEYSDSKILMETVLTITAIGKPNQFFVEEA